jgi:hypothetical protein
MVAGTAEFTPSKTTCAVICAVPTPTAVTRPVVALTLATAGALELHVIVRPVMVVPPFLAVAVSWTVLVVVRLRAAVAGEIVTLVAARITLMFAVSAFVSDAAITLAAPTLFPVTVVEAPDVGETVATAPGLLVQFTTRSVTTVPFTSVTVAAMVLVLAAPAVVTESAVGATVTLPTGAFIETSVFVAFLPSLVAMMGVFPTATPVTVTGAPELLVAGSVASEGLFNCHVTTRPARMPPPASFVTAVSCVV